MVRFAAIFPIVLATLGCGLSGSAPPSLERSIKLEELWSVGDGPGEENLVCDTKAMLAANKLENRFYVAPTCVRGQIAVLDQRGELVGLFGSFGEGPGELATVASIFVDLQDQLHVFQIPRGHSVFDKDHQLLAESAILPLSFWVQFLSEGASVRNMNLRSPDRVGKALHLVDDRTDEVLRSFGDVEPAPGSDGGEHFRAIASESGTTFWSARPFEYALEEWDSSGERLREIRREPDWWVEEPDTGGTRLFDIVFLDGFLWVSAIVPTFEGGALSAGIGGDPEMNSRYDSVIEVLDLETEEVVARLHSDTVFSRWVGDLLFSHRNVENGGVAMDVWRVDLSEPGGF